MCSLGQIGSSTPDTYGSTAEFRLPVRQDPVCSVQRHGDQWCPRHHRQPPGTTPRRLGAPLLDTATFGEHPHWTPLELVECRPDRPNHGLATWRRNRSPVGDNPVEQSRAAEEHVHREIADIVVSREGDKNRVEEGEVG